MPRGFQQWKEHMLLCSKKKKINQRLGRQLVWALLFKRNTVTKNSDMGDAKIIYSSHALLVFFF
jgi:hypothetical protein